LKSEHRVSSSKSKSRPTDPWFCDPTISLDNRYTELEDGQGAHRPIRSQAGR
jgi:hypothetical protein